VVRAGDLPLADQLFAPGHTYADPSRISLLPGPPGMRELAALIRSASGSPEVRHRQLAARRDWLHVEIEIVLDERRVPRARWLCHAARGRLVATVSGTDLLTELGVDHRAVIGPPPGMAP
jgi:hypothetical protein